LLCDEDGIIEKRYGSERTIENDRFSAGVLICPDMRHVHMV
jgi:hypothetical protein